MLLQEALYLGPLHMNPVAWSGQVTRTNFPLDSYEKFQPGFRDEIRPKILGTSSGAKFGKQQTWWNTRIITFAPIIASATLKAVSLQLNGIMWKIQQAMQEDAIRTARIHPVNRAEVFVWQNFQPAYRDPVWKNWHLGNQASPPSHMNASKILQRS